MRGLGSTIVVVATLGVTLGLEEGARADVSRSCRNLDQASGPADKIRVEICTNSQSDGFAMKGDLVVRIEARVPFKGVVNVENCQSEFTPAGEFAPKRFQSGELYFIWTAEKTSDSYIIEPQMPSGSVLNWQLWSRNSCSWSIDENATEAPAPARPPVRICATSDYGTTCSDGTP